MSTELKVRTKAFALRTLKLVEALPNSKSGRIIANQIGRAGTSVGANYRAACRSRSKAEFIAKLGIVEEEADECVYWLEIIEEARILPNRKIAALRQEAEELLAITVASLITATKRKQD
jgi:four helix bundle protein